MNSFLSILISILVMIVILGVLISIHEAGHLTAAKIFKVYCYEYSIGFGPALFKKKRKKGETYFSIRAIPLGGYVSMYGEGDKAPEGTELPPKERSLEAIAKWKKCIILLAGVTMNFTLGLILLWVSAIAFPRYYMSYGAPTIEVTLSTGDKGTFASTNLFPTYSGEALSFFEEKAKDTGYEAKDYFIALPYVKDVNAIILDSEVHIYNADGTLATSSTYVAVYYPSTLTGEHDLNSSIRLYEVDADKTVDSAFAYYGFANYPKISQNGDGYFKFANSPDGTYFDLDMKMLPADNSLTYEQLYSRALNLGDGYRFVIKDKAIASSSISLPAIKEWLGWSGSWKAWAELVPYSCTAVVKGFASIFTQGFKNVSGIIGMTAYLPTVSSLGGVGLVFQYAGLISINLAFFNLLPFPGLDGWQLLVTIIEGATRKKVPDKAKTIVSYIGLGLLFAFAIAIAVKDIVGLF